MVVTWGIMAFSRSVRSDFPPIINVPSVGEKSSQSVGKCKHIKKRENDFKGFF